MYVADTNVVSATDPNRPRPVEALAIDPDALVFLTVITIAELEAGVCKLERNGATRKAAALRRWIEVVESSFAGRILPFDVEAARLAGKLKDRAVGAGHDPDFADVQIAAIAASRGFTVLTRNARHFAPLGVPHLDPFGSGARS